MNQEQSQFSYSGIIQPKGFPPLPPDWTSEMETFRSSDGSSELFSALHHRRDVDWKSPRALIILHGLGEHGGRYLHFPHYLKGVVEAVSCLDHRGHGRSEGIRGHVERFDLYAEDAMLAIFRLDEFLKKRFGRSEIHLHGHSMGGLIALRSCFLNPKLPLKSVSVSSPLLGVKVEVPIVKKLAAGALSRLWGSLQMANELDARDTSHDPEVVATYQADRLVHSKVTPRFYVSMLAAMSDTLKRDRGFEYPLQVLTPLADRIVSPEAEEKFFNALRVEDKRLKTYRDFFHEPFNEIGKEKVFEDLSTWIEAHKN